VVKKIGGDERTECTKGKREERDERRRWRLQKGQVERSVLVRRRA
jgi:hypothetical protein